MFEVSAQTRAGRMLQAGRLTVTFRSPSGQHITIQAKCRRPKDGGGWESCPLFDAKVVFFQVPNQRGFPDKVAKFTAGKGFQPDSNADPARVTCARWLSSYANGQPLPAGVAAFEEDRCGRCGRALTDPVSIERGIGPECYGRMTGSQHETKSRAADGDSGAQKQLILESIEERRAEVAAREARKADAEAKGITTDPTLVDNVNKPAYPTYPTEGAKFLAETGRSKFQAVIEDSGLSEQLQLAASFEASYLLNTSPGWRPSDAATQAVRWVKENRTASSTATKILGDVAKAGESTLAAANVWLEAKREATTTGDPHDKVGNAAAWLADTLREGTDEDRKAAAVAFELWSYKFDAEIQRLGLQGQRLS